jgi:hypothetical protein
MASLNEILDIDISIPAPIIHVQKQPTQNAVAIIAPDVTASTNNSVSQDAAEARNNVRLMVAMGTQAIGELLALSRELKTPRTYEVFANMLKTMTELNKDLMEVHQQEATLVDPPEVAPVTIGTVVFVGSTADLAETINQKRKEKKIRTIETTASSVDTVG